MARQSKRNSRMGRRREDSAVKLMALGGMFALAPVFLGNSPIGKAFSTLSSLGWVMLAAGGIFLWLGRRSAPDGGSQATPMSAPSFVRPRYPAGSETGINAWPPVIDAEPLLDATYTAPTPQHVQMRPEKWSEAVFNAIEWRRFEAVIETLFQQAGFETKSQTHGADGGVDVWLYARNQPNAPVGVVQCKHWQGKRVGVDKIRELRGVMAAHSLKRGQFATTSTFTDDAMTFARENSINLLDVSGLLALIAKRTPDQQQALLAVALEGDYWRPTCVNCGIKMVERNPRNGGKAFWGCTNYPRCKTTLPTRGV